MDSKREFNKEQKRAIQAGLQPVVVIAAAGTGKTTVLVERIAYLIVNYKIRPERILAITYTNAATEKMNHEIRKKLDSMNFFHTHVEIGTIHAIFSKLVNEYIEVLEPDRKASFIASDDIRKQILLNSDLRPPSAKVSKHTFENLDRWKTNNYLKIRSEEISAIEIEWFKDYQELMKISGFMDYQDILIKAGEILDKYPEALEKLKNSFDAILIDECQDLTFIQWHLIKKLIDKENPNFFAVGDPNQAIYLFADATENIFDEFNKFFKGNKIERVHLVENYRSDKNIVGLANKTRKLQSIPLAKSVSEKRGNVKNFSDFEELIELLKHAYDAGELGKWVFLSKSFSNEEARKALKQITREQIPFCITSFNLDDFYTFVNLIYISFFDNRKPLLSLLKRLKILYSDISMGKERFSDPDYVNFLLQTNDFYGLVPEDKEKKLAEFIQDIKDLRSSPKDRLAEFVEEKIVPIAVKYFITDKKDLLKNVDLFISWLEALQQQHNKDAEYIALNMESYSSLSKQELSDSMNLKKNVLVISTVHKSKGLEWENVIVSIDSVFKKDGEVKRNVDKHVPYVAYTRAKHNLFIVGSKLRNL